MGTTNGQHSIGWYRDRLKKITGSCAGDLIGTGKGAPFTKTGLSYLETVAAERMIPDAIYDDDDLLTEYLDEVNVTSKAMRIGTEREAEARELYCEVTGRDVEETGSMAHFEIEGFASSPDGLVLDEGVIAGVIEIKCPRPSTYMQYLGEIRDAESLLKTEPKYYWQCMSHMSVTGAFWCDFIAYCPYNRVPLHVVRIDRDNDAIGKLEERVKEGLEYIDGLLKDL